MKLLHSVAAVAVCCLVSSAGFAQTPVIPPAPPVPAAPVMPQAPAAPEVPPAPVISPFEWRGLDELKWSLKEKTDAVKALKPFNFEFDVELGGLQDGMKEFALQMAEEARMQALMAADQFQIANPNPNPRPRVFVDAGSAYNSGLNYLNQRQFDRAIAQFDRVITRKEPRADGAMYHKAFAQFRSGRTQDALETIAGLRREFPQSRYLGDAKVLEADIRRLGGQPVNPAAADDDEIKLLAIQGIQRSEQAIPLLEGVLNATNSPAVKKRALFVLAQNEDPRARAILLRYAKGDGNPDLQMEAIRYLMSRRDPRTSSSELREIYQGTQDTAVKMAVIDAYRGASDKTALLEIVANKMAATELRERAVQGLGSLASAEELWAIYQQEPDTGLRNQIVGVFGSMAAVDQLTRVARTDADTGVRRRAISILGGQRGEQAAKARQALLDLYSSQTDSSVRMAIINSFNNPDSADALVGLARKETTLELKKAIVQRLSDLASRSKVAADYLMEVIK